MLPCKGRIQKRKTNRLQIITFGLQRTAGPYRSANGGHGEEFRASPPTDELRRSL